MKPHFRRGIPCEVEGCKRVVMSKRGRTKCREHHRLTVVWKNPSNQRNNQCAGFAEPLETLPPRAKQMSTADAGDHLMSLLRGVGVLDFSPVKRYIPGTQEFNDVARLYA